MYFMLKHRLLAVGVNYLTTWAVRLIATINDGLLSGCVFK